MEESYLGKCQCIHCHEVKSHKGIFVHVDRAHLGSTKYIGTTGKKKIHGKSTQIESTNYCCYGCGNLAKFLSPSGKEMCDSSANKCPVNRKKNQDKIKIAHEEGRIPGWANIQNLNRGWAKGLTKDIDPRVAKPWQIGKRFGASLTGHTQETKDKLQLARIATLESSPHVEWLTLSNGIKVQGSWELNVGEVLLSAGHEVSRVRIKYDGHRRYTPDFCIDENVYVEVKGWLKKSDIEKYQKVFKDHPDIKIYLIRDECKMYNYKRFIKGEIKLSDCEDLKEVVMNTAIC